MPDADTLRQFSDIAERLGWPTLALFTLLYLALRAGRALIRGASYSWARMEPPILGILSSHQDLMETAKDQMPKQTAILQELSAGQREHSTLLAAIHSSVQNLRTDQGADNHTPPAHKVIP